MISNGNFRKSNISIISEYIMSVMVAPVHKIGLESRNSKISLQGVNMLRDKSEGVVRVSSMFSLDRIGE